MLNLLQKQNIEQWGVQCLKLYGFLVYLEDLGLKRKEAVKVRCDNRATIQQIANNPIFHERTKHIEIDRNFIRKKVNDGSICLVYIPTALQVVDVFTKGLPKAKFEEMVSKLGM